MKVLGTINFYKHFHCNKKVLQTILRALAYASIAMASLPGVLAASWLTALAISISEAPEVSHIGTVI